MNSYEERQQARKERYTAKASKCREESTAKEAEAMEMAHGIPLGQPIHVGHYYEKRDRKYRERMGNKMEKSLALRKKADYYEEKAESVGNGGISNYDPDAAEKIQSKIDSLKSANEKSKELNKQWKKLYSKLAKANNVEITKRGYESSEAEKDLFYLAVEQFKEVDAKTAHRIAQQASFYAYPPYSHLKPCATDTAEIRRLEKRLKDLQIYSDMGLIELEKNGYKFTQDPQEMRLMFEFDGKPSEEVRTILKRNGFKWSRYACAWVRKLTPSARFIAKQAREQLDKLASGEVVA